MNNFNKIRLKDVIMKLKNLFLINEFSENSNKYFVMYFNDDVDPEIINFYIDGVKKYLDNKLEKHWENIFPKDIINYINSFMGRYYEVKIKNPSFIKFNTEHKVFSFYKLHKLDSESYMVVNFYNVRYSDLINKDNINDLIDHQVRNKDRDPYYRRSSHPYEYDDNRIDNYTLKEFYWDLSCIEIKFKIV